MPSGFSALLLKLERHEAACGTDRVQRQYLGMQSAACMTLQLVQVLRPLVEKWERRQAISFATCPGSKEKDQKNTKHDQPHTYLQPHTMCTQDSHIGVV